MFNLFEISNIDGKVSLNKPEILTIPAFERLLKRDKGTWNGRTKQQAALDFTLLFHLYDFKSPLSNYPDNERRAAAYELLKIEKDKQKEYEKDEDFKEAEQVFKDLINSNRKLRTVIAGYASVDWLIEYYNTPPIHITDPELVVKFQDGLTKLGKVIDQISDLEERVKKELGTKEVLRGNKEKGYQEDPDEDD